MQIKKVYSYGLFHSLLIVGLAVGFAACNPAQQQRSLPVSQVPKAIIDSSLAGNYLAGRFAQHSQDWNAAGRYMTAVLARDVENDALMQKAFVLNLGSGNFAQTRNLALMLLEREDRPDLAIIFLAADALKQGRYHETSDLLARLPNNGFSRYTRPILGAWALAGAGEKDQALELLKTGTGENDPTWHIHAGMIEDMFGRPDVALDHYRAAMDNGLTLFSALIVADFFNRYGQQDVTDVIYKNLNQAHPSGIFQQPAFSKKDKDAAQTITPPDGAALALFELTILLQEKRALDSALIYARLVEMLQPNSGFVQMIIGDIQAENDRKDEARLAYARVEKSSPIFWLAQLRLSELVAESGDLNQATSILNNLAKDKAMRARAYTALGDLYRRNEMFEQAVVAYTKALGEAESINKDHWPIIYARGMSLERINDWPNAEKDLLKALELNPENPSVLNYIGYSWANQGIHLDRALHMLEKAVTLRPDDGYILDSYGWALYQLGDYAQAVTWLEKAVQRVPGDATILDHLGDAYWQVNRLQEARFQWRRALDLLPDTQMRDLINAKLRHGLPAGTIAHSQP